MSRETKGKIITFYSYKGGTGRSMALANVACLLAEQFEGKGKILMIDWDLEAPGLHRFFRDKFRNLFGDEESFESALTRQPGLINLFYELDKNFDKLNIDTGTDEDDLSELLFDKIKLHKFIIKTDIPSLYLITAGQDDNEYRSKVRDFRWDDLYNKAPWLIRSFAELLTREYEFILIDSRTGLTDISGICTKLMPEKLVVVFTPNRQSISGVIDIARRAISYRIESDDLRPLTVYPLPSRIEGTEPELRKNWRFGRTEKAIVGYQPQFIELFKELYGVKNISLDDYFDEMQIQHVPVYSYGEEIAVLDENERDKFSLYRSFEQFTRLLVNLDRPWDFRVSGTKGKDFPTIVVDKSQRGDYTEIMEAIAAAGPGYKILVRPGLYQEEIIINESIELVGDGDPAEIMIQSIGKPALTFKASSGRMANFTIQQLNGKTCIDIGEGQLVLEGCDISCQSGLCIDVHNTAHPILRKNIIHDSMGVGILIHDNGQGTIEENEIFGNTLPGILISGNSNPVLRFNEIHDNNRCGIFIDNGSGIIEENEISGNAQAGIEIANGAKPMIRRNQIHHNHQGGILVRAKSQGTVENNDIYSNAYDGIQILNSSDPIIRGNRVHSGRSGGILIAENGRGVLEDNDVYGNSSDGIAVKSGGEPKISHNRIYRGKSDGVYIWDGGQGLLELNDIFENAFQGVQIKTGGNATLYQNHIHNNKQNGVLIQTGGRGILEKNEIDNNFLSGAVLRGGYLMAKSNRINKNGHMAILVYDGGSGVIEDNDMRDNVHKIEISMDSKDLKLSKNLE